MGNSQKPQAAKNAQEKHSLRLAIFSSNLPALTRLVLIVLLEHVRDLAEGCYPSKKRIAKMAGIGLRAVDNHVERAKLCGWLIVTKRPRSRGRHVSNTYVLSTPGSEYTPHAALEMPGIVLATPETIEESSKADPDHPAHMVPSPDASGAISHPHHVRTNPLTQRTYKGEPQRVPAREDGSAVGFQKKEVSDVAVVLVAEHVGADEAVRLRNEFARWPPSRTADDPDKMFLSFVKRRGIYVHPRALERALRDRETDKMPQIKML